MPRRASPCTSNGTGLLDSSILDKSTRMPSRLRSMNRIRKALYKPIVAAKGRKLGGYLLGHLRGSETILDVGCGDMIVTQCFHGQTGKKIIGLDVIDYNLSELPLQIYDGSSFPFADGSFDTVYAIFSLHHCTNGLTVLEEMVRVGRDKIIIVEEPYSNFFTKYYTLIHDWMGNRLESFSIDTPFHFHTDKEWKRAFTDRNLQLIHEQRIFQFPWFLGIPLLTRLKTQKLYVLKIR